MFQVSKTFGLIKYKLIKILSKFNYRIGFSYIFSDNAIIKKVI